jgi:spermidine synthase
MSSQFTTAEIDVARLALGALDRTDLDVAVGGLGLGYTAQAVLQDQRVRSLVVVEALPQVIQWHRQGLLPLGTELTTDARCRLVHGDFFAMVEGPDGLDPDDPGRRFDCIVVDIDHSPRHLLSPSHASFYEPAGVRQLADRLTPDGVFSLWSNDAPDDAWCAVLVEVFAVVRAEVVTFANPLQDRNAANTVYIAAKPW